MPEFAAQVALKQRLRLKSWHLLPVVALVVAVGVIVVVMVSAAGPFSLIEPENAMLGGGAMAVDRSGASGGKTIRFGAAPAPTPTPPPGPGSCSAGQVGTPPNCFSAPPFAAGAGKSWRVSFSEEFNGSDYDHNKLTPCFDWNYGSCTNSFNQGRERYLESQNQVSNGTVKMIAAPLSPPYANNACLNGLCTYQSGLLSTARPNANNGSGYLYAFTYGYVEARLKFPATQGFFTAFWMLPADPTYNYRTEIDILEQLGHDPNSMWMNYSYNDRADSYTPNAGVGNNGACPVKNYSQDFVRVGVDWEPNRIAFYIDGTKCGEFTNAAEIENGPMQLIMDLMVDHRWQRDWGYPLLDATLTRQLEVDYIRVYQQ